MGIFNIEQFWTGRNFSNFCHRHFLPNQQPSLAWYSAANALPAYSFHALYGYNYYPIINLQPSFLMPIPADLVGFYFFTHNKGQMYFPRRDGAFGSSFLFREFPANNKRYGQAYKLEQTHLKMLRTENQVCDEGTSEPNTTLCITRHCERTVGCSIGMAGADPNIRRCHEMIFHMSCIIIKSCILGAIT